MFCVAWYEDADAGCAVAFAGRRHGIGEPVLLEPQLRHPVAAAIIVFEVAPDAQPLERGNPSNPSIEGGSLEIAWRQPGSLHAQGVEQRPAPGSQAIDARKPAYDEGLHAPGRETDLSPRAASCSSSAGRTASETGALS